MMHRLPFYWVLYAPEKQQSIIVMQYLSTVEPIIYRSNRYTPLCKDRAFV